MKNKKSYQAIVILYPLWLIISFGLIYYLITNEIGLWRSSSIAFQRYFLFIQPISILGAAYLLTKGSLLEIERKLKPLLVTTAILLVFAYTLIQWTSVTTTYGEYGKSVKHAPTSLFIIPRGLNSYERETFYREAVKVRYDSVFKKIWTFNASVFFSVFLILYVTNKSKQDE